MATAVTRAALRARARELADLATASGAAGSAIADSVWDVWLDAAAARLWNLLVLARGESYYARSLTRPIVAGTATYYLPSTATPPGDAYDMAELLAVIAQSGSDHTRVLPFDVRDLDLVLNVSGGASSIYGLRYRLLAQYIELQPTPSFAATLHIHYIPAWGGFTNDSSTFEGFRGWEDWIAYTAAILALQRRKEPTAELQAERGRLEGQIMAMAALRDRGAPVRVHDTRRDRHYLGRYYRRDDWDR